LGSQTKRGQSFSRRVPDENDRDHWGSRPESTIEYYRLIIDSYHEQKPDGSYPAIMINSIGLKKRPDLFAADELDTNKIHFKRVVAELLA